MGGIGVGHDHAREEVVLHLGEHVQASQTFQIVEAVGILQRLHLRLEDEVEAGAEHAAEGHDLLGQAADPEVDGVDPGGCRRAIEEGHAIDAFGVRVEQATLWRTVIDQCRAAKYQGEGHRPFLGQSIDIECLQSGMRTVGSDEVDQRGLVLEVHGEIDPAGIRLQLAIAGHFIEFLARRIERRHPSLATACEVDGGQVQRQAEQVVAQGLGDELVDLVAQLPGHAARQGAGGLFRRDGDVLRSVRVEIRIVRITERIAQLIEHQWIEEGLDQPQLAGDEVRIEAIHRLGQHRVAEAVHHVGELGHDCRIQRTVVHLGGVEEHVHLRLHLARELLEHQVLILHLGGETRGLEQSLAIPHQPIRAARQAIDRLQQPLVDEVDIVGGQHHVLGMRHHAVMLGVEHMVDGGQTDILVAATVAGNEVGIEQLIIIGVAAGLPIAKGQPHCSITVGGLQCAVLAVEGTGVVRNVVEEGVIGTNHIIGHRHPSRPGRDQATARDELRITVGARDELAVLVGSQQRYVHHIGIAQHDAQHVERLGLDLGPGRQAAIGAIEQAPGSHRPLVGHGVLAQEHLVRGMRGVGLVLVDEGRGLVDMHMHIVRRAEYTVRTGQHRLVGGPGQHHEVGRTALDIERVVRLQRDEHRAVAALVDQVQAVIEELAEQSEPGVEAGRQPFVRRAVGDKQRHTFRDRLAVEIQQHTVDIQSAQAGIDIGLYRCQVGDGLVDDQVGDGPRVGIHHVPGRAGIVRVGHIGRIVGIVAVAELTARDARPIEVDGVAIGVVDEVLRRRGRERLICRTEVFLPDDQIVERTIHRAQAPGQARVGDDVHQLLAGGMALGDDDLVENELQVGANHPQAVAGADHVAFHRQRSRRQRQFTARYRVCGRRGHPLQHAVIVLVNGDHANRQTVQVGADAIGDAILGGRPRTAFFDDILEDARAWIRLELPDIADRPAIDQTIAIVLVADACGGNPQQLAHGRRIDGVAIDVENLQRAGGREVAALFGTRHFLDEHTADQHQGAVGELDALDIEQAVGTFVANVVGDDGHAGQRGHGVVLARPAVQRGVEAIGAIEDLALDHQLARVVNAVEHQRDHVFHAVEGRDLVARTVVVLAHTDAHVEPAITVDQVVAAATFQHVAAATAEDDIAATEGGLRPPEELGEHLLQVGDAGDALGSQQTALGTGLGDQRSIGVVAAQDVGMGRAGQAFHLGKAVEDTGIGWRHRRLDEVVDDQVDLHTDLIVLVHGPVEAGVAVEVIGAFGADHDVIAALAYHLVEARAADKYVMAVHGIGGERLEVVAGGTVLGADLDPVVALVTGGLQVALGTEDEVVAGAGEDLRNVLTGDDEVIAMTTEDQIEAVTAVDHVVTVATLEHIVTAFVGDDVVTGAAFDHVVAVAAFQAVVAAVAPQGVVADAADHHVVACGAAEHHVLVAGVTQVVGVDLRRLRVIADNQWNQRVVANRVGATESVVELRRLIHLEDQPRPGEDIRRQVHRIGMAHHQLGEGVVLHLGEEVEAIQARQVVETIAVLQRLHLRLEDEVEAGTEHAAEGHDLLGQTADPEVDVVDPGAGRRPVEEGHARVVGDRSATEHDIHGRGALGRQRGHPGDAGMRAIGGDEVDQRFRVLEV